MHTTVLRVGGMSCRHCVREVTSRLRDVAGVDTVTADAGTSLVRLSGTMRVEDVLGALSELNYPVKLVAGTGEATKVADA
jgi:copper chaperone CopZ